VLAVATATGTIYFEHMSFLPGKFVLVSAIIAVVTGNACLVFAFTGRKVLLLASGLICLVLFVEAIDILALPSLDPFVSPRPVAKIVRQYPQSSRAIVSLRLNRGWEYGLNFYLRRQLQEWSGDVSHPVLAVVSLEGMRDLRKKKIQYTILDQTSFEAMLVEIGKNERSVKQSGPLSSQSSWNDLQKPLATSLRESRQPH
jgi:hypothetical protein